MQDHTMLRRSRVSALGRSAQILAVTASALGRLGQRQRHGMGVGERYLLRLEAPVLAVVRGRGVSSKKRCSLHAGNGSNRKSGTLRRRLRIHVPLQIH